MITEPRVVLATRQRALTAAIERINAAAEGRALSKEELEQIDALAAAVATLARTINLNTDIPASAASVGAYREHAPTRGPPPSANESIWRWRTVCTHTGLSRATVWRLVKAGRFPKPIHITSGHAVGWAASEVQQWILARIAQRDQQHQRAVPHSPGRPRKPP